MHAIFYSNTNIYLLFIYDYLFSFSVKLLCFIQPSAFWLIFHESLTSLPSGILYIFFFIEPLRYINMSFPLSPVIVSLVTYHTRLSDMKEVLNSLKQQGEELRVIVIDNDSGPVYQNALSELIAGLRSEGLAVEWRAAPRNGGFGYGHNLAFLDAPPSDYVLLLNPDVVMHPGALTALIGFLQTRPEAGLVVPKVFYPDGRLQPLNKRRPTVLDLGLRLFLPPAFTRLPLIRRRLERYSMMDKGYDTPYPLPFASGCCMLFRRSLLMRLGGFDEGFFLYFEDADISERANILSQVWFCPDAHITHSWQRGSRKSLKLLWIMLQSAARYFAKWGIKWW